MYVDNCGRRRRRPPPLPRRTDLVDQTAAGRPRGSVRSSPRASRRVAAHPALDLRHLRRVQVPEQVQWMTAVASQGMRLSPVTGVLAPIRVGRAHDPRIRSNMKRPRAEHRPAVVEPGDLARPCSRRRSSGGTQRSGDQPPAVLQREADRGAHAEDEGSADSMFGVIHRYGATSRTRRDASGSTSITVHHASATCRSLANLP